MNSSGDSPSPQAAGLQRGGGELAALSALAEEARAAEVAVADSEARLREAQERLRDLLERRIPEAMDFAGIDHFSARGLSIKIANDMQVKQPPRATRAAAHRWLEEHGQGGLIRKEVSVPFGAGTEEQERAAALLDFLGAKYPETAMSEEVNSSSLKAFLKRALEAGESPPLELFGARAFRVAKIETK